MPLNYPTFEDYVNTGVAELRRQLPDVDPAVFATWASTFIKGCAALADAVTQNLKDIEKIPFVQTAEGEFLDNIGQYDGIARPAALPAEGNISLPGTIGTLISSGTIFTGANGLEYISTAGTSIAAVSQSIATLTRVGTVATATTAADHTLATGLSVTVSGAAEVDYNGTFEITVTARNQFTYTVSGSASTPATGTISYTSDYASVNLQADDEGSDTNIDGGGSLALKTPIAGANDDGTAQFDGISGGADEADDETYRSIILISRADISGVFTEAQIKVAALSVSGNTRVFVKRPIIGGAGTAEDPAPGQVSVFFLRDNDANILPTPTVIANTKQAIIDDGALPANTPEDALFVQGPTLVAVNYTFGSISPDTPTMRTAVENSLAAFFEDSVDFEENVLENSWLGAIQNTQDPETGDVLELFTLTSPSADIPISDGEIGVLGTVAF